MKKIPTNITNITTTILIVLLLIAVYMVANISTVNTCINNASNMTLSTVDESESEIVKFINKFEVEDVKVFNDEKCVIIKGRVTIDIENKVYVLICGQKAYIFAELLLPPSS